MRSDGCDEVLRCAKHDARWLQPEGLAGTRGGARDAPRSSAALVGPWSGMDTGLDTSDAVE